MSKNIISTEKKVRRDVKKILKHESGKGAGKHARSQRRGADAQRAIKVVEKQAAKAPLTRGAASMFRRAFTDRDAARLAWMLTVCDPFGKHHWSVPPIISPGIPLSEPRIYRITFRGFATANAGGRIYIGANADMWLPNPSAAALTIPEPRYGFLGNAPASGVGAQRGQPVHYTTSTYVGCDVAGAGVPVIAGSTGNSYPSSISTAATGLNFAGFPDPFINTQLNNDPVSANAYQRATNISVGLRVRPTAPGGAALVPTGVLMMTQQILGDTTQTNATAASSPTAIGGVDAYNYLAGVQGPGTSGGPNELDGEMIGREEWDIMEWPRDEVTKTGAWLSAAAIPNQSCSLGAWVPKQTGDRIVGQPQLAVVGAGMQPSAVVEWEASYTYAFYGAVSYEVNAHTEHAAVPGADLQSTAAAASDHMMVGPGRAATPARAALASVVQPAVSSGELSSKSAADWVSSGKSVIEAATGSSIGDLIGEGLGFLGAMLL